MSEIITAAELFDLYTHGVFPMADDAEDDSLFIVTPDVRSILPVENLHVSKRLQRTILKAEFEIRVNSAFHETIKACAETKQGREKTWINQPIQKLFNELHEAGHAHSLECWKDGQLVGGLYGLQIGGAFCGESMFSRATDASKVALVHLAARLHKTGFTLLDAQFPNPHLVQFGQMLISQKEYLGRLERAKSLSPDFNATGMQEESLVREYISRQRSPELK